MKTKTLFLAAFVLGIFCTSSINAELSIEKQSTEKQLTETFKSFFQNIPLEDLMVQREKSNLKVSFEINNNNELTNIHVVGSNPELVQYAVTELTHSPIKVDPTYEHKKYYINILCVLR